MSSEDVCYNVALDAKLFLSWIDLLLCTNHAHIPRDDWHKGMGLKQCSCSCTATAAAAAAVLIQHDDLATTHTTRTHTIWYTPKRTHIHIHTEAPSVCLSHI